jgi:hypothetical protein
VFANRVPRRIFGPETDEVTGGWRKLQNEERHNLYSSSDIIRMIELRKVRWAGHVERMAVRSSYKILVGKPEVIRPLKALELWEDNNKMDVKEIWCDGVDWIHVAQDMDRWRALEHGKLHLCQLRQKRNRVSPLINFL